MRESVAKALYFLRSALGGIRQSPFVHFVAVTTIAIALFTTGLARTASKAIEGVIARLGGEVELTVYLDESADSARAEALAALLASRTGGSALVVTSEAALQRLIEELGASGQALIGVDSSPLPVSIELRVPREKREPAVLKALAAEVGGLEDVHSVEYGQAAVERLSTIARILRLGGAAGFAVVLATTVVIVAATLQLAIYARREEIEIQKLVGASDRFVKAPFLLEGFLQGLSGALLAAGGLLVLAQAMGHRIDAVVRFLLGPSAELSLLTWQTTVELCLGGIVLGLCGSFVAVGRFLRV